MIACAMCHTRLGAGEQVVGEGIECDEGRALYGLRGLREVEVILLVQVHVILLVHKE